MQEMSNRRRVVWALLSNSSTYPDCALVRLTPRPRPRPALPPRPDRSRASTRWRGAGALVPVATPEASGRADLGTERRCSLLSGLPYTTIRK